MTGLAVDLHQFAAEFQHLAALHQHEAVLGVHRHAVPGRQPVVAGRHHVDAELQTVRRLRMDGQADRAGELVGQQRAPGPAALDHPVGALLGVALQGGLRALVVGGQAVLVEEAGDGAVQQQAFFAGQQGLADAFQRLGVAVDQQLAELLVVVALGLEGAYVLQVEHADMGGADLLDHQAQGILVGADVRIADPHQVAEHPAVGADGDLRARCIEQLDALAQVVEERQRQALGHVRTAVEDLAGVRRLGRKRRQDEFDGLAGFDEGGDARQLDLFDAADLVRFAGALAPLGVGDRLLAWGVPPGKVRQLDWWQDIEAGGLRLTATPAQHFSGRGLHDGNRTLWCSWVIESAELKLFFSGDSGYFDGFAEIGRRYGPFDLTMLETGAYNEHWPYVHMHPQQTLQAHRDLGGRWLLPIHNGTFDLAMHAWYEPFERILELATEHGVRVSTPMMGERIDLQAPHAGRRWWREVVDSETQVQGYGCCRS